MPRNRLWPGLVTLLVSATSRDNGNARKVMTDLEETVRFSWISDSTE